MKNKKADMALSYIFAIFVSTIVVLVVVSLVIKWGSKSGGFVDNLFGKGKEDSAKANEFINVKDLNCTRTKEEIVKFSKLCYEKGKLGKLNEGYCYLISGINATACSINVSELPLTMNYTDKYNGTEDLSITYNKDINEIDIR